MLNYFLLKIKKKLLLVTLTSLMPNIITSPPKQLLVTPFDKTNKLKAPPLFMGG